MSSGTSAAERFFQYLNSNQKPEDSPFLKEIIKYNYDDCKSTQQLYEFLIEIQKDYKIQYLFESEEPIAEKRERKEPAKSCEEKGKELLSSIPQEKLGLKITETTNKEDEKYYLAEILGNLLQFHIREGKVDAWAYYHYLEMDNQEKLDDSSVIANCRFVRSDNFSGLKIHFEPHQDIKHRAGSEVKILESEGNVRKYKIEEIDLIRGIMKVTGESLAFDKVFDLIPHENFFFKSNIYKSLLKTSNEFAFDSERCGLKKSLYELLTKKKPDIRKHEDSLILNHEEIIKQASDHALNLNESVLCIQGPPGTGKTYTAASMILYLMKNNKKVGIIANSHKAIDNVIKEVFKQKNHSDNFRCQRIVSKPKELDPEQESLCKEGVNFVQSGNADYGVRLTGGTNFFFSREQQENEFDYLFVDEASQVSLANLVAASRATKNIILLGDQNQLDQPIKASHPGETGLSVLSYYTDSERTISEDKGIFLPISYRMNPEVCSDISKLFYDDLLSSHESTNKQKLILCDSLKQQIPESGVYHIPVNHLGNEQSSMEEAEKITNLYQYLLECQWVDQEGHTKPITEEDILITAPFNMQVAIIKEELLKKSISTPRVASVDKFQGQEAPVSILSLGASTIKDAPRGIGFLLNRNRINVALSRARCLSIVVASTNLTDIRFNSIENMELMNIFCKIKSRSLES